MPTRHFDNCMYHDKRIGLTLHEPHTMYELAEMLREYAQESPMVYDILDDYIVRHGSQMNPHWFLSQSNDPKAVHVIMRYHFAINFVDKSSKTVLHSEHRDLSSEMLATLISYGIDVTLRDIHGRDALFYCRSQAITLIRLGLNVNHRDHYGNTPLHFFFYKLPENTLDNRSYIQKMIAEGADLNIRNNAGMTVHDIIRTFHLDVNLRSLVFRVHCHRVFLETKCPICMEPLRRRASRSALEDGQIESVSDYTHIVTTPCGHLFCEECLISARTLKCPVCRSIIA